MFGITFGSLLVAWAILGIGNAIDKMGRSLNDMPLPLPNANNKKDNKVYTLDIEEMYSPNNKITNFTVLSKKFFFLFVENKKINEMEYVHAETLEKLKVMTIDVLKKMADIENGKADRSILF